MGVLAELWLRQRGLHAAAWLASDQHDFAAAAQFFEESRALRRELGEAEGAAAWSEAMALPLEQALSAVPSAATLPTLRQ